MANLGNGHCIGKVRPGYEDHSHEDFCITIAFFQAFPAHSYPKRIQRGSTADVPVHGC